jgi:hypothetical protein
MWLFEFLPDAVQIEAQSGDGENLLQGARREDIGEKMNKKLKSNIELERVL